MTKKLTKMPVPGQLATFLDVNWPSTRSTSVFLTGLKGKLQEPNYGSHTQACIKFTWG